MEGKPLTHAAPATQLASGRDAACGAGGGGSCWFVIRFVWGCLVVGVWFLASLFRSFGLSFYVFISLSVCLFLLLFLSDFCISLYFSLSLPL